MMIQMGLGADRVPVEIEGNTNDTSIASSHELSVIIFHSCLFASLHDRLLACCEMVFSLTDKADGGISGGCTRGLKGMVV